MIISKEIFIEIKDKLIHQRLINLLIEKQQEYIKKDKGYILIKNNYWDIDKDIREYLDKYREEINWV